MDQLTLQSRLEKLSADEICTWICEVEAGLQPVSENFYWPNFALFCSVKARSRLADKQYSLEWAKAAIAGFKYITQHIFKNDPHQKRSIEIDMMYLRSFLIRQFDVDENDPVLKLNDIVAWFFTIVPFSPEEAVTKSQEIRLSLKNLVKEENEKLHVEALEEIRFLRQIKIILNVIFKGLLDDHIIVNNTEINKWILLKDQLF